jgi:hypothetical protein
MQSNFSSWFDNLEKETLMGIVSACSVESVGALRLRNATDYRLPFFGPHGTKLGHSWFQLKMKSDRSSWFDNFEKEDVSGHCEWMRGWSRHCTPSQVCCRLPPTYLWTTWHQTRAFLILMKSEKWFFWLTWQFRERRRVWALWALAVLNP